MRSHSNPGPHHGGGGHPVRLSRVDDATLPGSRPSAGSYGADGGEAVPRAFCGQRLSAAFVELADTSSDDFDVVDYLQTLIDRCMEFIDVDAAGLLLADQHGVLHVVACTAEPPRLLEHFQVRRNQGPCVDCFTTGQPLPNFDLEASRARWPHFGDVATRLGFAMSHTVPLRLRQQVIGVIQLLGKRRCELDASQVAVLQGMADVATIGLLHERTLRQHAARSQQLQTALDSRVLIEQAKGMLAERSGISVTEAFALMRAHARRAGRPLATVAEAVVAGDIHARDLRCA